MTEADEYEIDAYEAEPRFFRKEVKMFTACLETKRGKEYAVFRHQKRH